MDDFKNVGILAMEVYTPSCFVKQSALEEHTGVAEGKYTIGLGQEGLAITGDTEDINSICLTAVAGLLEKCVRKAVRLEYGLCFAMDIGARLTFAYAFPPPYLISHYSI